MYDKTWCINLYIYLIRVTNTSKSKVASVLNKFSNRRLPSLFFSLGSGNRPSLRALYTIMDGNSIRRTAPRFIPIMHSSNSVGTGELLPIVHANSFLAS